MAEKQSILGRIAQLTRANINALLDRAEGELRRDVLRAVTAQPVSALGDQAVGELLDRIDDDAYEIDEKAAAKELREEAAPVLDAALSALEAVGEWTTANIEAALKAALLDGLELKPRKAFGPIRVAVTGATVSPPLFESMELLGAERSLARLRAARSAM